MSPGEIQLSRAMRPALISQNILNDFPYLRTRRTVGVPATNPAQVFPQGPRQNSTSTWAYRHQPQRVGKVWKTIFQLSVYFAAI
jgi:hypothetical protein